MHRLAKAPQTHLLLRLVEQSFVGEGTKVDVACGWQDAATGLEEEVAGEEKRLDHALVKEHDTNGFGHDRVHLAPLEHCFLDILVLDHATHNSHLVGEVLVGLALVRLVHELDAVSTGQYGRYLPAASCRPCSTPQGR